MAELKETRFVRWRTYTLGNGQDYWRSRETGSYLVVDGCRRWLCSYSGWWLFARVDVDVDVGVGPLGVRSVLVPLSLGYITRVRWCARARGELGKWENHNLRLHHRCGGTGVTA